jgi:hypothetical protein
MHAMIVRNQQEMAAQQSSAPAGRQLKIKCTLRHRLAVSGQARHAHSKQPHQLCACSDRDQPGTWITKAILGCKPLVVSQQRLVVELEAQAPK